MKRATLWSSTYHGVICSWRQALPTLATASNVLCSTREWVLSAKTGLVFNTYPARTKPILPGTPASLITMGQPLLFMVQTAIIGRNIRLSPHAVLEMLHACYRLTRSASG